MVRTSQLVRHTLLLLAPLLLLSTGCVNRLFFAQPQTWSETGAMPVAPTLEPVERLHVPTAAGKVELYHWNLRTARRSPVIPMTQRIAPVTLLVCPPEGVAAQTLGDKLAPLFGGWPIDAYAWNYPGVGSSVGPPTLERMLAATPGVFDAIHNRHPDRPVVIYAISLGTCPAAYIATQRDVAALILDTPVRATEIPKQTRHGWWNLWVGSAVMAGQVPDDCDVAQTVTRVQGEPRLLVVHGDANEDVPAQHGVDTFNNWPNRRRELLIIPDAGPFPGTLEVAGNDYAKAIARTLTHLR